MVHEHSFLTEKITTWLCVGILTPQTKLQLKEKSCLENNMIDRKPMLYL